MFVPELDKLLGLEVYATKTFGIGGTIRCSVDDFKVEETLVDGSVARIGKKTDGRVLHVSVLRQPFLLCVLIKRNWDTIGALKSIADTLEIDQTQVHVAGMKDARAVTAQYMTIENAMVEDVEKIHLKDLKILPIGYFRDEMSTFFLLGNKFNISIRKVEASRRTVRDVLKEFREELQTVGGIPNFFGHQRFGTIRPITHLVGKAIVNGDFQLAGMIFLAKASQHEHAESRKARETLLETRDFERALSSFPKQLRYERQMLRHLAKKPDDFVGAFRRLPFRLQMLFIQAYQSHLFNRFLSERIRNGLSLKSAEVGDFVVNVERSGLPMVHTGKIVTSDSLIQVNEMIAKGKLKVAIPLVGFRQKLSQGVMGDLEEEILELEQVKPALFRVSRIPRISGQGGLRPVASPVKKLRIYKAVEGQVQLSFMLLKGSYATMLLREIMKPRDPRDAGF